MTPKERQRFLRLLGQYRDAQTVYQKALDEHLRHLLPPPMLVTNKDLVDPLVSGMEQTSGGLYTPVVVPKEVPEDLWSAPIMPQPIGYRFSFKTYPRPTLSPFRTYVFRDPDGNPPPEERFEVNLMEALVGWKAWSVRENGIWSVSKAGHPWPPDRPFVARCAGRGPSAFDPANVDGLEPCPEVVTEQHSCGVYAADNRPCAQGYAEEKDDVLGQVYGWGRYVRGTDGWRAQYAYPKNFLLRSYQAHLLDWLRPYHVPIYVEQPILVYNPEEDGYEHRNEEADGDRGTAAGPDPDEEDD